MALIECPECGKKISEYAEFCIGCGCPMHVIEQLQGGAVRKGMFRLLSNVLGGNNLLVSKKGLPSEEYIQLFDAILGTLTPREEEIIRYRFRLKDGCIHSYEELSAKYNVSQELIIQNEARALKKLRNPARKKCFEVIWEFPSLESTKSGLQLVACIFVVHQEVCNSNL